MSCHVMYLLITGYHSGKYSHTYNNYLDSCVGKVPVYINSEISTYLQSEPTQRNQLIPRYVCIYP